ncbi:hypothetical protein GS982_02330 [Rhodococcus hoagii]|uniref:Uncharacterized protein n=1 Tax=Rhodococcus hoagii TaxID=43767 RepID=A0A9Q2P8Q4_RHOHA|nr:hypothetical protein [Prescottella equi]MBM4498196.1 hypothetical protein [Prescottella equi]MBM4567640.1 hypothetical protein [Prescottella equi]MBM4596004.1 hypothetical protein [Prescottella equi]MBP0094969.1 hypothetical protein [Prescottella equi]MCU7531366.1 hypothetical protein [Prescottella equi]
MSTAEQIIAEHRVSYTFDGEGSCTCGEKVSQPDHAAHVVAALTKAGKAIVELPEADETVPETEDENSRAIWSADGGHVTVFGDGALEMGIPYRFNVEADEARAVAAALLAAARVAEGGDQP